MDDHKLNAANKRIRWRCRRGLKELDVIFARFLDTQFEQLSQTEKRQFDSLLDETDMDLFEWCTGKSTPENSAHANIVSLVRRCNESIQRVVR